MADNIKVLPSTGPTAVDVATTDVDGVHHPHYKAEFGKSGKATTVSTDDPLPTRVIGDVITALTTLTETMERVQEQLSIITGVSIGPGEGENL